MKKFFSRRLLVTTVAAATVTSGIVMVPQATAQDDQTCTVTDAEFDWGVRDSWNNYIYGPIAKGTGEFEGGITKVDAESRLDISYTFDATDNSVDDDEVSLGVDGSMHFSGHDYGEGAILDTKFTNPRLEIDGTEATLYADAYFREFIDTTTLGPWQDEKNIEVGEWTLTEALDLTDGTVEFASQGNGKLASEEVFRSFGRFYEAPDNDRISPIVGSFELDCEAGSGNGGGNGTGGNGGDNGTGGTGAEEPGEGSSLSSEGSSLADVQDPFSGLLSVLSLAGIAAVLGGIGWFLSQNFL